MRIPLTGLCTRFMCRYDVCVKIINICTCMVIVSSIVIVLGLACTKSTTNLMQSIYIRDNIYVIINKYLHSHLIP